MMKKQSGLYKCNKASTATINAYRSVSETNVTLLLSVKKHCVCVCTADDLPKKKPPALYKPTNPDGLAYLDFSVSTTGMLAGVQVSSALILITRANRLQPVAWTDLPPFIHYFFIPGGNSAVRAAAVNSQLCANMRREQLNLSEHIQVLLCLGK